MTLSVVNREFSNNVRTFTFRHGNGTVGQLGAQCHSQSRWKSWKQLYGDV